MHSHTNGGVGDAIAVLSKTTAFERLFSTNDTSTIERSLTPAPSQPPGQSTSVPTPPQPPANYSAARKRAAAAPSQCYSLNCAQYAPRSNWPPPRLLSHATPPT